MWYLGWKWSRIGQTLWLPASWCSPPSSRLPTFLRLHLANYLPSKNRLLSVTFPISLLPSNLFFLSFLSIPKSTVKLDDLFSGFTPQISELCSLWSFKLPKKSPSPGNHCYQFLHDVPEADSFFFFLNKQKVVYSTLIALKLWSQVIRDLTGSVGELVRNSWALPQTYWNRNKPWVRPSNSFNRSSKCVIPLHTPSTNDLRDLFRSVSDIFFVVTFIFNPFSYREIFRKEHKAYTLINNKANICFYLGQQAEHCPPPGSIPGAALQSQPSGTSGSHSLGFYVTASFHYFTFAI